jgi:predicted esterase
MLWLVVLSLGLVACRAASDAASSRPAPSSAKAPPAVAASASAPALAEPAATSAPAPPASASAAPPWPPPAPAVQTDWCTELVSALDEETCYVLPERRPTELLVYLHGIVPPGSTSVQKTNFQEVVANAARRAGVAALIPRGETGLAGKARRNSWSWPTSGEQHVKHAKRLAASLEARQKKLEALTGVAFDRRYLAGSSAGAYFTVALALHGYFAAEGYGAMSGGARVFGTDPTQVPARPFYIGYGTHDNVGPAAEALGASLTKAGWRVLVSKHPLGHGAKEIYLDEAFVFWRGDAG